VGVAFQEAKIDELRLENEMYKAEVWLRKTVEDKQIIATCKIVGGHALVDQKHHI
jgi:hypothetical protein